MAASSTRSGSWRSRGGRPSWPADRRLAFRRSGPRALTVGLVLSAAIHAAILTALPAVRFGDARLAGRPLRTVGLPRLPPAPPAVDLPAPPQEVVRPGPPAPAATPEDATGWTPPFTPHDIAPRLLNGEDVVRHLADGYPAELRAARAGGEALLWMLVSERGDPVEVRLARSSGQAALDSLARLVTGHMRFRPAFARNRAVAVWIAQPIRFAVEEGLRDGWPEERPPRE